MNVLFASLAFEPGHVTPFPGVNRYSVELAKALRDEGITITIATPRAEGSLRNETWQGIAVHRLGTTKTHLGPVGVVGEVNLVSFAINLQRHTDLWNNVDLLYTNVPLFPLSKAGPHPPVVFFLHHPLRIWRILDLLTVPFGMWYEHETVKTAARILVPSSATKTAVLQQHRLPDDKVVVVHHGVDGAVFKPMKTRETTDTRKDPLLMYTGLLERRKGVDDLVSIFQKVSRKNPKVKLLVVAAGKTQPSLSHRLRKAGLQERVRVARDLDDTELAEHLNRASVFMFPSRLEGFGLAAVEAMACGKPVVAYASPVSLEIIGDGGILVPERDTYSFASCVEALLNNPAYAMDIGRRARLRVEREFNWQSSARAHIRVFERVCA